MDLEKILEACAIIGLDVCCFTFFYSIYKEGANCLKALKEAKQLEMNSELQKKLEDCGGTIPYAVISGKVKALSAPLRTEHFPFLRGVLQEKITNEFKVRWIPGLRVWGPVDNNINRKIASVPFSLVGKSKLFQKKISVEISEPFSAQELVLTEVYNDYRKYDESLGEAIIGLLSREHIVGIKDTENLLLEDTTLTAIGKLTSENGNLIMASPDDDLTYFLTPLTYDSLYKKISSRVSFYKGATVVLGLITVVLLGYYFKKSFSEIWRRICHARDLRRCREARKLKRQSRNSGATQVDENRPKCVICLDNFVEIILLDCGHACLCFSCSEQISTTYCPICRSRVHRLIPVYMP
ncbi:Mitochondrial ubiquitin ligase activator of nfkb 1 [Araneus ventricosus]|uniref:RING-type E3 ubiquitin transferase n=2 Tax=Araneus ventricosus TaxID=182803 RepID=A0A4Y2Q3T1_ARAVE|nr:Mitochondrial ubiquitin ligase activator of nfkb 1 [Araneus ventricosus]